MTKKSSPSNLEIHLLGPFCIAVDGRTVAERHFTRRKPKLLIKLLALQPHHQLHREQLMELLWPNSDPEAAVNNLHKVIHLARHALEPTLASAANSHFIITKGQHVSLTAPGKLLIDVDEFDRAATAALRSVDIELYEGALQLYQGDLLVEDLYEDWVATRREQLRGQFQELLLKLAELLAARHDDQQAIERLKQLLNSDATIEAAHRKLMQLYAALGNKHQALRQYELCCQVLKELGTTPEPETAEVHQRILAARFEGWLPNLSAHVSEPAVSSIAILPLVNASTDPGAEYLSDGITESIINSLSQLPQLKVLARATVFRYKGRELDAQSIGRELQARAVLMGRVLQFGDHLIVRAELVETSTGTQLWGEQYNRTSSDIFEVQEQIAREIAAKLPLRLTGADKGRLGRRYTDNTEAYRLYLKGRYFWNRRTLKEVERSIKYFQEAIEIDPDYALAYVGLADSYTKLGDVGVAAIPPREAFSKAKTSAVKALASDNSLAEAHTTLGHLYLHDYEWSEAQREFEQALELNANYATTHHWYAYLLLMTGRKDQAFIQIEKAIDLDPLSLPINADYGELLYFDRRYTEAVEQLEKVLELDPHFYPAHLDLARIYVQKGMYQEAIGRIQKARELSNDSVDAQEALAHTFAVSGQEESARKMLEDLNRLAQSQYVSPYAIAVVLAALHDKTDAFEWLGRAAEEHAGGIIYLNVDPKLDPLRSDPRFEQLVRRIKLEPVAING